MHDQCRILADENIPRVREWFAALGRVDTLPGRTLTAADVVDADILLVRSVTRVDRALLEGSRVRFVGTATIGTDHLDLDWLAAAGIAVASAPGSNAQSVVDYVLSALAAVDDVLERLLAGGSVGVVGLGNVGGRLLRRLRRLGIDAVGHDPFVAAPDLPQVPLTEILLRDVVCLHLPLTQTGGHPTRHLLNAERLAALRPGALLLNAGRGATIDNAALLDRAADLRVVLDVWEHEPHISLPLLQQLRIGTPHIAGYSLDGKLAGTRMLLEAGCRFLHRSTPDCADGLNEVPLTLTGCGVAALREALLGLYDPCRDDAALRAAAVDGDVAVGFDRLRKHYPVRREISAARVLKAGGFDAATRGLLAAAGFRLG